MNSKNIQRMSAVVFTLTVFTAGYVCGTMGGDVAEAQLQNLGTDALKGAAAGGGLGSVGEMGTALVEMEQHVSGLQKNLDSLKKVKAALGG